MRPGLIDPADHQVGLAVDHSIPANAILTSIHGLQRCADPVIARTCYAWRVRIREYLDISKTSGTQQIRRNSVAWEWIAVERIMRQGVRQRPTEVAELFGRCRNPSAQR